MENKKKGPFTGFRSVFAFTAEQTIKGKGFKISSIGIGLVMFIVALVIPIIMAVSEKDEQKTDDEYGIEENIGDESEENNPPDAIVVLAHDVFEEGMLEGFLKLCGLENVAIEYSDINVENGFKDFSEYCVGNYENPLGMQVELEEDTILFEYYIFDNTDVSKSFVDGFSASFDLYYNDMKYMGAGIAETEVEVLNMPVWTNVSGASGKEREMGVVMMEMIAPAVISMIMLMMTVLYGQSVTKVVLSEKSSKLMEVLLTSVKPYGLVAGKIIATAVIAIAQMLLWGILLVVGFVVGDKVAEGIYPDYQNLIFEIIDIIAENSSGFSAGAIILSITMLLVGFLMYCVWAGFIAAIVDKVDDVSSAMNIYQIPIMIGWIISYVGAMLEWNTIVKVAEYIPVFSPFIAPANVMIGKSTIVEGIISFALLIVFTLGLIYATGKVYKGKIFNRK